MQGDEISPNNPGGLTLNEFYNRRYGNLAIAGGAALNKDTLSPNTDTGYALFQLGIRPTQYINITFTIFGTTKVLSGYIKPDGWVHVRPTETLDGNVFLNFNISYPCYT